MDIEEASTGVFMLRYYRRKFIEEPSPLLLKMVSEYERLYGEYEVHFPEEEQDSEQD
ncbi:MAG: hypothetical protein U0L43_03095 [Muribaculaceae bacterium]|nr:hypothetical protein [Muribaculaceae bacterium]